MLARLASALLLLLAASDAAAQSSTRTAWERTLDRVARGVVALRVSVPRSFDTHIASAEIATGFVVDAERGIILTNRHVVKTGPTVAEAVFLNHEEVPVHALYRDPVHDFGFFRYDPADVRFMEPVALELRPDLARVGTEVRVIGNDAGEKISILDGTLARLDRDAPRYARRGYNDFNTFYFQAASSTSGGSSGSPVVDIQGRVLALNAGGSRRASSSFYLPLDRVVRALEKIQAELPVPRGTLQTVFGHFSYDELRRLGLRPETEAEVRRTLPDGTGMLAVTEIVPKGPADGRLQIGDVVVRVEGELVTTFIPLEAKLDDRVGDTLRLEIERAGAPLEIEVEVADLHGVTPAEYLEVGGAVLHPVSYQAARSFGVPIEGIHVASSGYSFSQANLPRHTVITALGGKPVSSLDELEAALAALPQGARVPVRYFPLQDPTSRSVAVLSIDRRWFPMRRCARDDATGRWPCTPSASPPASAKLEPFATSFRSAGDRRTRKVAASLATVDFGVPYRVEGVQGDRFRGAGLVVDAERGLVVVDRDTVPIAAGDVRLTFAASVEVPGQVVWIHPEHNFAVVSYDPALLGDTPVRSAEFAEEPLQPGDEAWLVALGPDHDLMAVETRVSRVAAPLLPLPDPPRFRETNLELIHLPGAPQSVGGVLVDEKGRIAALWASFSKEEPTSKTVESFFAGIPATRIEAIVRPLRERQPVSWRTLGAELRPIALADARARGLSDATIAKISANNGHRREILVVERLVANSDAAGKLQTGDLVIAVNGTLAPGLDAVERAAQAERVPLRIVRDGRDLSLEVATQPLSGAGTDRFLSWAGALLHLPHRELAAQKGIPPEGVYVAWFWFGSPANRYGLRATSRIVAVDGVPTPDLDSFLAAVEGQRDRDSVRLRTLDLEGTRDVVTLKLDLEYWPTVEFRRGADGWERVPR